MLAHLQSASLVTHRVTLGVIKEPLGFVTNSEAVTTILLQATCEIYNLKEWTTRRLGGSVVEFCIT